MATKTLVFTAAAPVPRSPLPALPFNVYAAADCNKLYTAASPTATEEDTTSWGSRLSSSSRPSDVSDGRTSKLPTEVEALKQLLRRKWPRPLFRFSVRAMRRVVVSPVPIPSELADPRARIATVSGVQIPLTRRMHQCQRNTLVRRRLPDTVDEYVVY